MHTSDYISHLCPSRSRNLAPSQKWLLECVLAPMPSGILHSSLAGGDGIALASPALVLAPEGPWPELGAGVGSGSSCWLRPGLCPAAHQGPAHQMHNR